MSVQYNQLISMESVIRNTDLKFEIIRSRDEFLSLRSAWIDMFSQNHNTSFYLSFDWFYFLICIRKISENLYIIVARKGTEVVAIIPCFINQKRVCFFRHRTLEIIGNDYSPYRGCLVNPGQERAVANGLVKFLLIEAKRDWEVMGLKDVSNLDLFIVELQTVLNEHGLRISRENTFDNIICDLSSYTTSDSYFKSFKKNFRNTIRRHINQMNRNQGFDIILPLNSSSDIEKFIDDYRDIRARSWKREENEPLFHLGLAKYLFEKGFLRLFILYMNPEDSKEGLDGSEAVFTSYQSSIVPDRSIPSRAIPVAVIYFIVYGKYAYLLRTSYREDYAKYGPGITLMWFSFKYLFEEENVEIIDHQRGVEDYKLKFGGRINELRFQLLIGNPMFFTCRIDLLCRDQLFPPIRRMKRRVLHLLRNRIYKGYTYGVSIND